MKELRLLKALGTVDIRFPEEAMAMPPRRRGRILAAAACFCMICGVGVGVMVRLGYFSAGCSAWAGSFADGGYYHTIPHKGLYRWDDTDNEKVLGAAWCEGWQVNDYGVYYKTRRSLYVLPHEGTKTKLFAAGITQSSHIGFTLYGDNVVVTVYNKHKERFFEVLIDGRTGALLETVTPLTDYDVLYDGQAFGDTHLLVGTRSIVLETEQETSILTENGLPLTGKAVSRFWNRYGEQVWFTVEENRTEGSTWYILQPNGRDRQVTLPTYSICDAAGDFAFWVDHDEGAVCCGDTRTGVYWTLSADTESEFYELSTDGSRLFSCVPWDDYQRLWQVEYEEGRPVGLTLLDSDICEP